MSGETIRVYGVTKVLESNGAEIANNAVVQANDAPYSTVTDGRNYPDADFVLTGSFSVAPTENTVLAVYARPLAVDGTNNAQVPEASRPTRYIGSFAVNNVTSTQAMICTAYDLPQNADYYVYNSGTGQSLAAGWTLRVTPRTYSVAA